MFFNVYEDPERAKAYAGLEFAGTYYLAFRDLPEIIRGHVRGRTALDFGCGAGRSTRFLKSLGFEVTGVDISASMIEHARTIDPAGSYQLVGNGDLSALGDRRFDLILIAFAFDNIPDVALRRAILGSLRDLLTEDGRTILVGSTPEIYVHEFTSFTTRDFPENRDARSGDPVRVVMKDVPDARPVLDILWTPVDYEELFRAAGLELLAEHKPLGTVADPRVWLSELSVAPWVIYVCTRSSPLNNAEA
jgi:SAM-dependent methyltransferase